MSDSSFTPPDLDSLNEWLPAYEFVSRIASDDTKAVYLVKQKSLDRKAAVKFYSPELSRSEEFRKSFADTTKLMARLKHPNLIGVYDSGLDHDMLYLVGEFVAGKPLWNSTRGKPIHIKHVKNLMEGIVEGVCHAHKNDIHHGSLSLGNILIDESHTPKIGGFSQATGDTSRLDPAALRFRAPELGEHGAEPTAQADIYSMGVILREMAIGQTAAEAELAGIEGHGLALKRLVKRATSPDPSKRHRSAEDFKEELLSAFGEEGSGKSPAGGSSPLAAGAKLATGGSGPSGGAARGAGASPGARPAAMAAVKPASPFKLWIHLIIIVMLLVAISIAWKAYKEKKAETEAAKQASKSSPGRTYQVIHKKAPPRQNKRWEDDAAAPMGQFPDDAGADPVVTRPKRDVAGDLQRLRSALVSGARREMPAGTLKQGNHYFLHVDIPMTWEDAFWYAIDHGGHLAVPTRLATTDWMRDDLVGATGDAFWVGAAKSGAYTWTLADGRSWRPKEAAVKKGSYAAVGSDGSLEGRKDRETLEFVIQWTDGGPNPGSLESLLETTRKSLATSTPVYPPGTVAVNLRRYLYVPHATDWKTAVLSARSGGGNLAVISDLTEKFSIDKLTMNLDAPQGIWIGGFHLPDKGWRWSTGEAWTSTDWPQDKAAGDPESALLVQPGGKWEQGPRKQKTSGYLIEWSEDSTKSR
ncbi:MAG: protein kinase [Akkermansiaceae bacterium]|nr:protein kinase [Akkermansiaceae bacterium]